MIRKVISRLRSNVTRLRSLRSSGRSELGAALVETALTMTLLLILLFGIIEISLALYSYHFVAAAANQGTRYAIVRGSTWGSACSSYTEAACTATPAQIASYVASLDLPGITVNASDVCVEYFSAVPAAASSACAASSTPNGAGDVVQVTITYPFSFSLPGFARYTWSLKSTSQMSIAN